MDFTSLITKEFYSNLINKYKSTNTALSDQLEELRMACMMNTYHPLMIHFDTKIKESSKDMRLKLHRILSLIQGDVRQELKRVKHQYKITH